MPEKTFSKRGLDREGGMGGPHYSSSFSPSLSHTVFCNDKRVGAFIHTNPEMIDCSPWPSSYIFQDLLAMRSLKLFKTLNTLKMTAAPVFETSVTLNNNSPILDYVHPDDQTQLTFEMTPGFKPFTVLNTLPRFALWVFWTPLSVFDLLAAWCMVHDLGGLLSTRASILIIYNSIITAR